VSDKGKVLVVTAPGRFEIVDLDIPAPAPDEVLIEVRACATCTNWELNTWRGNDIFSRPGYPLYPQNPGSPGHEAAGVVIAAGDQCSRLKVGDHVAVYGSLRGPENDAHATHITRPESQVALLDPALVFVDAAPLEMALCAVRSLDMAGDLTGKSTGFVGLGPAGILHLQVARARGAARVVGIDTIPQRLAAAAPYADLIVDARDAEALRAAVEEGVTLAWDCSGAPAGMRTALDMAREAFYVFSVPHGPVEWGKTEWLRGIPILPYNWRGGTQADCLQRAADMLAVGQLETRAIVSAVLPYTRYDEGLALLESREAIKVVYSGWE
jgi:threonine dehydrogenase-like Zn-dependent dehydrogenase